MTQIVQFCFQRGMFQVHFLHVLFPTHRQSVNILPHFRISHFNKTNTVPVNHAIKLPQFRLNSRAHFKEPMYSVQYTLFTHWMPFLLFFIPLFAQYSRAMPMEIASVSKVWREIPVVSAVNKNSINFRFDVYWASSILLPCGVLAAKKLQALLKMT